MRISTLQFFQQNLQTFNAAEARLLELQQQVATGIRVDQASDNPEAFITALKAQDTINQAEQFNRNIALTRVRFTQQEETLGSANEVLSSVRDAALQARNGVASNFDRSIFAQDIRARKSELESLLKTQDVDGLYIFGSGSQQDVPVSGTGPVSAVGDNALFDIEIAAGRAISTGFRADRAFNSPVSLFYTSNGQNGLPTGGGRRDGNVLDLLDSLAIAVERGDVTEIDTLNTAVQKASDNVLAARVETGTKSRQLDDAENFNLNQIVLAEKTKESSVGADLSDTITQLTQTDAQLRALQVTYSQITKNSLFDLI